MTETNSTLDAIRRALKDGYCVPVVGAGVSISAGAPSWTGHLKNMAVGLDESFQKLAGEAMTSDPTDIATLLQWERIRNNLPPVPIETTQPGILHKNLARWNCRLYLTTNFDDLLERAIQDLDGIPKVLHNDELTSLDLNECLRTRSRSWRPYVVKLCSSLRNKNPGVETREEFTELIWGQNNSALDLLTTILRTSTAAFIGCGMADPLLNAAIDKCFASKLGYPNSFAFLPEDTRPERLRSLDVRRVKPIKFPAANKTEGLQQILGRCAPVSDGPHHLMLFEPGMPTKLEQLLLAVEKCNAVSQVSVLGIITTNASLALQAENWGLNQSPQIQVVSFVVRDTQRTSEIINAVLANSVRWNAIVTPYEYATKDAAEFAHEYNSRRAANLVGHPISAARLSRNKTAFRKFIEERFVNDPIIATTSYDEIALSFNDDWRKLLELISSSKPAQQSRKIVVKPIDASGSTGVRPIDLDGESKDNESKLTDLLRVMQSMPVESETSRCETARLLVEERLSGEEFSLESRRSLKRIEAIVAHWKVDIDSDDSRFFERIFVTLPNECETFKILEKGNEKLLKEMNVADGVFHSEYRMSDDLKRVHPLEVGLRPGGGMVNYSVDAARGVDLHETSIQCSLSIATRPIETKSIVATGLVFATSAEGGVLPPIRFSDGKQSYTVVCGDIESLQERLQRLIDSVDREEAYRVLCAVVDRENALCNDVRDNFRNRSQRGLGAKIDLIEMWMKPGDLITEEEAAYVAGLRIVASDLPPVEAMAEATAAMRLCLASLECKPEKPLQAFTWRSSHNEVKPEWWNAAGDSSFESEVDSWNFSRGLVNLIQKRIGSVLDLGCGSSKAAIPLLSAGIAYTGVDVQEAAADEANVNFARIFGRRVQEHRPYPEVVVDDVSQDVWLSRLNRKRWDAVVANLPYLPGPGDKLPIDVNGGEKGLRFIPTRVLQIAEAVNAHVVVINVSSLCDLKSFSKAVAAFGYGTVHVVATVAPLGEYSRNVLDYLEKQEFPRLYGVEGDLRQVIYAFTLVKRGGISIETAIHQVDRALKPHAAILETIVEGTSNW
jgi:SAM-dependent methyltransferase